MLGYAELFIFRKLRGCREGDGFGLTNFHHQQDPLNKTRNSSSLRKCEGSQGWRPKHGIWRTLPKTPRLARLSGACKIGRHKDWEGGATMVHTRGDAQR
jgi:hypothetical protein